MFFGSKFVSLSALVGISCVGMAASAAPISLWTFETSAPATAGPFTAESGTSPGVALGFHASASVVYSSPAGNGSAKSFSSNFWGVGDYYQFKVDTTGQSDVYLSFDQTASNTGPRDFKVEYSTDNVTYTSIATYSVLANAAPNPTWNGTTGSSLYSVGPIIAPSNAFDGKATLYVRLTDNSTVSANGGTVATAGSSRIDNVTFAVLPEPTLALAGCSFLGMLATRRRKA